jgi:hypothetical protein
MSDTYKKIWGPLPQAMDTILGGTEEYCMLAPPNHCTTYACGQIHTDDSSSVYITLTREIPLPFSIDLICGAKKVYRYPTNELLHWSATKPISLVVCLLSNPNSFIWVGSQTSANHFGSYFDCYIKLRPAHFLMQLTDTHVAGLMNQHWLI